jgi:membrane protease subunit (stomatin/prohibitin family)
MQGKQSRSVIQWIDPNPELLIEQWSEDGDEIKNASKLIVGPGQGCLLVLQGKLQSVCDEEGITNLKTGNTPFITRLLKVMQGFQSEHKVGIWFFRKTILANQKFGTPGPIKYLDPVYNFPVGLRVFGNFSFRINDPSHFFRQVSSTEEYYYIEDARQLICSRLIQPLTETMAISGYSFAEVDLNRSKIAQIIMQDIGESLTDTGLEITDFRIDGTSFDEDTARRINRISDLKAEDLGAKAVGLDFTGLKLAENLGNLKSKESPLNQNDPIESLKRLKQMREQDLISEAEFQDKKKSILERL